MLPKRMVRGEESEWVGPRLLGHWEAYSESTGSDSCFKKSFKVENGLCGAGEK